MFICDKCNKEFNYKYLLTRHFNNKNGYGPIKHTISDEDNLKKKGIKIFRKINTLKSKIKKLDNMFNDNKCGYCKKIFSNKSNLKIHIKSRCQNKKTILNDIQKLTDELDQPDKQEDNKKDKEMAQITNLTSQINSLNNQLPQTNTTLFNNIKQEIETNIRSEEQASCATRLNSKTANLTSTQEDYTNRLNIKDEAIAKCTSDKSLIQQESAASKINLQSKIDRLSATQPTTVYKCPVSVTDELDNLQYKNKIFMISNGVTFLCCIFCIILVFIIKK